VKFLKYRLIATAITFIAGAGAGMVASHWGLNQPKTLSML